MFSGKKIKIFFLVLILAVLLTIFHYAGKVKKIHYTRTEKIGVPYPVLFNSIVNNKKFSHWATPLRSYQDSMSGDTIYYNYDYTRFKLTNGPVQEYTLIEKIARNSHNKIFFKGLFYLNPLSDTLTEFRFELKAEYPVLSFFNIYSNSFSHETFNSLTDSLKQYVYKKKKAITFSTKSTLVQLPNVSYVYTEHPMNSRFPEIFGQTFPNLLIQMIQLKAYDSEIKSFLILIPGSKGNYKSFRNAVPVQFFPEELPPAVKRDTLKGRKYVAVNFNYDYDFLPWDIYQARKYIPQEVRIARDKPVLVRFLIGHSKEDNPEKWQTQILFPLKDE